jgi:hypothetical protein
LNLSRGFLTRAEAFCLLLYSVQTRKQFRGSRKKASFKINISGLKISRLKVDSTLAKPYDSTQVLRRQSSVVRLELD